MLALKGLKVLDFSHAADGPTCGMMLAQAGAEVIKVEPLRGDPYRQGPVAAAFFNANRNKRGLALNLQTPEGREIAYKLAATADVVIESFTPGTADRLGIGYRDMEKLNPRIVYCSVSGFGQSGPYSKRPVYDPVIQAMSGFMATTGEADGPPVRVAPGVIGLGAAFIAGWGIALAIIAREKTGRGQHIDAAFFDTAVFFMSFIIAGYSISGYTFPRMGSANPVFVPYQCFQAADRWVFIAVTTDRFWQSCCTALGLEELAGDSRFSTADGRLMHRDELTSRMAAALRAMPGSEILSRLEHAEVPCAPVNSVPEVTSDPQVKARGMLLDIEYPGVGLMTLANLPFSGSGLDTPEPVRPPMLGEHTREILAELGYDETAFDSLALKGVILKG
jgi:crotonobetainyl-CoA:carnitine CoA-transferase CaiB-like acyl-CoA transferase